jgi:hypothetical protein
VRAINLGVRFLLEMAALTAFAYWGARVVDTPLRWALAVGAPLAMALAWGRWIAPKAAARLEDPLRLGVEVLIFGAAALALVDTGLTDLGIVLATVAALSLTLMVVWDQRGH